ncbi:hypothetical protein FLB_10490 [Flavobacterium succinicans]|uniref:Uncharacterized protein n=1 Tax=Flavobacterium succinicans TaxID=29536 RepID=A0A199XT91_9FLAO|nr:hypothetical protein FLB_10490 [Flavobacterium succinicans]
MTGYVNTLTSLAKLTGAKYGAPSIDTSYLKSGVASDAVNNPSDTVTVINPSGEVVQSSSLVRSAITDNFLCNVKAGLLEGQPLASYTIIF